jgi:glyoxylase-like metal-dependent hydrolase (beta-lactamase superfamily II)
MLEAIKQEAPPGAESIDIVVNTHGDGDHWFGNALVEGAEIYSTTAALEQMRNLPPNMMAMMVNVVSKAPTAMGRMMKTHFSRYEFMGINPAFPNKTVDGPLTLDIGGKAVELIPVGPAHTKGDLLVYLPEDRVLFAGDIVFAQGTPIVHAGPISNCIEVLQRILDMDVDVIVPGHGPITDKRGASAMMEYLEFIRTEAGKRFDAGMGGIKAARDIDLGPFLALGDPDRIIINIIAAYNEFSNNSEEAPGIEKMWLLSEVGDY